MDKVLANKSDRSALIHEEVSLKNEVLANKLRFLSSMIELEKFPTGNETLSKGRKVISLFLVRGALFHFPYKDSVYGRDVEEYNVAILPTIRMHVLEEVASEEAFLKKVNAKFVANA